jgi:hypothetical protein
MSQELGEILKATRFPLKGKILLLFEASDRCVSKGNLGRPGNFELSHKNGFSRIRSARAPGLYRKATLDCTGRQSHVVDPSINHSLSA